MLQRYFKNLTPKHISLICSASIIIISMMLYFIFSSIDIGVSPFWWFFILFALVGFVSYWTILFFVNTFLFNKIKLIYKTIHRFKIKGRKKSALVKLSNSIMDDVQNEVLEWARDQSIEFKRLKEMEEYRKAFLGDISHELKTPIFNIQGYVHTLIDGGISDENVNVKYLNRAAKNIDRLLAIVKDLDIIAKLESESFHLEMQNFDIKWLVKEVIEEAEIFNQDKNITFEIKGQNDKPIFVNADIEAIRKVLSNLIINSIKYGNDNGSTKIGFYDMDKYYLIEVSDDGSGIAQEHLSHLFNRFFRVEKSRSREVGGSGLGLAIVKHLIEAHKQTVNVRSTVGIGSTFGFTVAKAVK